jgi:two-component system, LytTR family, response regulator
MRTLIVGGGSRHGAFVRRQLEMCGDVQILGSCGDGRAALDDLHALRPDLVILDIDLPCGGGERVLEAVAREPATQVVVLAESPAHAARAFAAEAVDYVVLPADAARVRQSVARARTALAARRRPTRPARWSVGRGVDGFVRHLAAFQDGRHRIVASSEIDWIEAAANYALVHAGADVHRIRETLRSLERKLNPQEFMRVHRSAIVRLDRIAAVEPLPGGELEIELKYGTLLRVGRTYLPRLREWLAVQP